MIRGSGSEQRGALGGSAAVTIAFVLVWALALAGGASWVIDYDPKVQRGLFERMRALETSDVTFLVPMMKDGLAVDEFQIFRDDMGEWSSHLGPADPLPGGRIHRIEEARRSLQGELGQAAEVRVAVFLPTGLVLAVGRHGDREAAVYLTYAEDGPGHTAKYVFPPEPGRLFTSAELPALFEAVMKMPSDQPNGS